MATPPAPRSFVLYAHDGAIVEAPWHSNRTTLLRHLREERGLCGTKEGCAAGDCGACLVVQGELDPDRRSVRYRSVNACLLPLGALDGTLLITVEDLAARDGRLHPVQQAMVDCHASQCGFCTPGFVMSLYAEYLAHAEPRPPAALHERLAGNLCRCTGYASILRAARCMHELPRIERDSEADLALLLRLEARCGAGLRTLQSGDDRAAWPRSSDEVADLLQTEADATLFAGGTDLGLRITKAQWAPRKLIHLTRAQDLRVAQRHAGGWWLGAGVTLSELQTALLADYPELRELWSRFASPPVRDAATLGGNIANASPVGDTMPTLIALDARLRLRRGAARRELPLEALYLGDRLTALEAGEFIEAVWLPARAPGSFVRAYKVTKRFDDDISAVGLGMALQLDSGVVRTARIAFGGMAAVPARARAVEARLLGRAVDRSAVAAAGQALVEDFTPRSDHRGSAAYRMRIARNLLLRAVEEHLADEPTRVVDYGEADA